MSTPTNILKTPMSETEQDSFFGSKEKFHQQLQDIFQTILRLTGPDHFDQLCQWMEYKQYYTIDDFYESSYNDLENFDNKGPATEYKWKGKTNHLADPDHDPESGDIYEKELFQGKQSFVYSVLVTSLQTEKGRELVKEFEGDARSIILKLHHNHTKSNVAQHDIITLTTDITNLTLNDSWKGTVRHFLSHFKEKLRLLDSLVPVSDQLSETTRITFFQKAVQQYHDLRQIHVMDSVWRFKTDLTEF